MVARPPSSNARACEGRSGAGASALGPSSAKRLDEADEGQHGVPRRALRIDAPGALGQHRAGHVAVQPRGITDELLQEQRRRDRAAEAIARVLEVSDVALELLAQLVDERHAPELFARLLGSVLEA